MADTLSTSSTLDNLLSTYYVKIGLPRLKRSSVLYKFAQKTPLPRGEGKVVVWNAWSNFGPATAALGSEGVNPHAASLSSRKVSATIAQYVRVVKITDFVDYTAVLRPLNDAVDVLTDSAKLTLDNAIQLAIFKNNLVQNGVDQNHSKILSIWMSAANASAFHSGSLANTNKTFGFPCIFGTTCTRLSAVNKSAPSVSSRLSLYTLRKAVKQLKAKNARPFENGRFVAIANSDAVLSLMSDPDFEEWFKYTSSKYGVDQAKGLDPVPVCSVLGCDVYESNNLPLYRTDAHSCDLTFIFGKGAFGVTDFGNGKEGFNVYIKRPGPNSTDNPADLFSTGAYKLNVVAAALNVSSGRTLITHMQQ